MNKVGLISRDSLVSYMYVRYILLELEIKQTRDINELWLTVVSCRWERQLNLNMANTKPVHTPHFTVNSNPISISNLSF